VLSARVETTEVTELPGRGALECVAHG
jgi:hypothetical protein